jgi:hypothetical protein
VQRRGARRILIVVALAVVVLLGLAWWVLRVPYEADVGTRSVDCDVTVILDDPSWDAAAFDQACDDARDERRTTALLIGAAVATAAAAASTIPSRRLTGEALGPESPAPDPDA